MKTNEKEKLRLTADEAEYIKELIIRNEYVIRAEVRSVLREKYEQIGEDCIAEIFFLACKKTAVLKKHENPDAWIALASRKVAQNMARKHNTHLNRTTDEEITDLCVEDNVFEDALYDIWMENGSVNKLLNTLTPHERKIYDLLYKRRLPSKEVARIMGVSDSTIRNTAATIRRKVRNALETKLF